MSHDHVLVSPDHCIMSHDHVLVSPDHCILSHHHYHVSEDLSLGHVTPVLYFVTSEVLFQEKRLESVDSELDQSRSDLRLAFKRISDLQAVIEDQMLSDSDRCVWVCVCVRVWLHL